MEIIGLHQAQIHPEENVATYKRFFELDHQEATPTPKIGHVISATGKWVPVEILAHVFEKDGKRFQMGLFRDITSRFKAEQALRESETKFRSVIEQSYDGIVLSDEDGIIIDWNRALERITGLRREDTLNKPLWKIQHGLLPEEVRRQISEEKMASDLREFVSSGHERIEGTIRINKLLKGEISPRILHQIVSPILVDNKKFMCAIIRDITEQKQTEERISYQATLLENVSDAIISTDPHMIIKSWNKAAEMIYGYQAGEVVGKQLRDVIPPEFVDVGNSITDDQLFKDGHWQGEVVQKRKDGRIVYIFSSVTVIRDQKLNVIGIVAVCHDITREKQAEDALKDSEEMYRTLFENANVGICITDSNGKFLEVNQAAADLLGCAVPELIEMHLTDVYVDATDLDKIKALVQTQRQVGNYPVLFKKKNTTQFWVSANVRILRYKEQPLFLTTIIDIDERKRASDALKQSLEDALELSRVKTRLVTFASHELKTPLVPIIGWADFILSSLNNGKKLEEVIGKEEIASILNSASRLEQIIDGFLDLGRLEEKRLELHKQPVPVVKLLVNAIKNVEVLAYASKNPIYSEAENMVLNVDAFRIEQVFINILSNAIKYSSPGKEIRITTSRKNAFFKIIFTDHGCGFTPEDLKKVWRPFANISSRQKEGLLTGTGIGLYLSKGLVEMHGGVIEIFSDGPDKGARVEISLPLDS